MLAWLLSSVLTWWLGVRCVTSARSLCSEPGTRVDVAIMRGRVGELECRGLRAKFDGGADTISVSVPASCLDEARWVRLGVGATGFDIPEGEMPETVPFFGDDGHRNAIGDTSIGKGPRIHRG